MRSSGAGSGDCKLPLFKPKAETSLSTLKQRLEKHSMPLPNWGTKNKKVRNTASTQQEVAEQSLVRENWDWKLENMQESEYKAGLINCGLHCIY